MAYEFKTRRVVEFSDTDAAGIVHFATFFRYMEAAEHAFFRSVGLSIHMNIDGQTVTFPRVHADADFHSPLRFEDTVEVHMLVREVRTKAIVFEFYLSRITCGEPEFSARGSIITACVTKEGGKMKAVPIPQLVRDKIEPAPIAMVGRLTGKIS